MSRIRRLLRDFDYDFLPYAGRGTGAIVQLGIPGHTKDRIWGIARGELDAADEVCAIVHDPEFTRRLAAIQGAI